MTDFSDADDYLDRYEDDNQNQIEVEYGNKYDNLDSNKQSDMILNVFFMSMPSYRSDANHLRDGINLSRHGEPETQKITYRSGKSRYVVRSSNGQFKRWLK